MVSFKSIFAFGLMAASVLAAPMSKEAREVKARNDFTTLVLETHNKLRAKHYTSSENTPALKWRQDLALSAVRWTNNCLTPLQHSGEHPENAYGFSEGAATEKAITDWYNEQDMYDYSNPGYSDATGHFTQVVWKNAQYVGCAWSRDMCGDGMYHFFCDYDAGNMLGEFAQNVLPCGS